MDGGGGGGGLTGIFFVAFYVFHCCLMPADGCTES